MTARNLIARATCLILSAAPAAVTAADRDRIEDSDYSKTVTIVFSGDSSTVTNGAGVTISYGANTASIAISSAMEGVQYVLSGTSANGYVQITSTYASKVTLNGVNLTSSTGPALSMISAARNFVVTANGSTNSLTDGSTYTRSGSGTLYTSGPMILSGKGSLSVAGVKSHAIYGGSYIRCMGGDVKVSSAVKDAIHSKTLFRMDQGSLDLTATGDGIDGDSGAIQVNGGSINIRSLVDDTKAMGCEGLITINGGNLNLTVNGVQSKGISGKSDIAINGGTLACNLAGAVYLETVTDVTTYVDPSYCTGVKCDGNLTVGGGSVTITHTGLAGKGISADGNVAINGGTVDVFTSGARSASFTNSLGATDTASADCIDADGTLTISSGTVIARSTGIGGDCLSSDLALTVGGGNLTLTTDGASGDCLATNSTLAVNGGTLALTVKGGQGKGFKSTGVMTVGGGSSTFTMSGGVVQENVTASTYNPVYCTAMKSDSTIAITAGNITMTHSGIAGKGISADGNLTISGGTLNLTNNGANSATFTNSSNATDMASADCIKADGTLSITGGSITATSTGGGADAISGDGVVTIGTAGITATPLITASVSGARVLVSGSDYMNAKALKADGNLTMNGGTYKGTTTTNGSEAMESKATLTINGGIVEINSYDDGINAATKIAITGGLIYSYASNNDGIDSNGTFAISGGTIISSGASAPEEGFDCDQNNFAVTGGTLIGTGGATSTPTTASSTQRTVLYKGTGTANTILHITSASGTNLVYKIPRTYAAGGGGPGGGGTTPMTMLISNAGLVSGTTYSIISGATVTGGTEFHGYYTGATVTGGTTLKTFNPTAIVTTVQ
ncbi:carbohydrate-binding domain-containing protein [Haloferula sp. BvORR071]|uniref:carbohydrate-binding domain-containing protein n=1 Tax=Haloferula sp. BvORR071 TaxID=1396141 RepID=UPI0006983FB7|nr:carbohydrate-binding domain-containing protein [Haloferula sp. BvORR071]